MRALSLIPSLAALLSCVIASSGHHGLEVLSSKDLVVSRGLNYHYQVTPPTQKDKPYLLLLHGWPSSPYDWRYQIKYFSARGFGIVVPDMLGFGGTAKPLEAEAYKSSLITRDIVDILDFEQIETVIAIGHDWGAKITGRLANFFQDRFLAFGFVAVGYLLPNFPAYAEFAAEAEATVGYDEWSYWAFLSRNTTTDLIKAHPDSFWSLLYSADTRVTINNFSARDGMQNWLEADKKVDSFLSKEEYDISKEEFFLTGVEASLNWYKILTSDIERTDNQGIPVANYNITKPVYYAGATRDYVCVPGLQRASFFGYADNFTFQDYDASHWVLVQKHKEINEDFLSWIEGLVLGA